MRSLRTGTEEYKELEEFIKIALSLPCANAGVERAFSCSKRLIDSRESISIATLKGQRVLLEEIHSYGGAAQVPITPLLVHEHNQAKHKYCERLEKEKQEKAARDKNLRIERELKRKRLAKEKEQADYSSKKKRFESKETELKKELIFHEARLSELENTMEKTRDHAAQKAAMTAHKLLREEIKKLQKQLEAVKDDKFKLAETKRNKSN